MSVVLRAQNLGKRYHLGAINRRMFYQEIQSRWARWRGKEDPNAPLVRDAHHRATKDGYFDALSNVSFDIKEGESVGIIGRNGAGKSTLLKILSQITSPSAGRVLMKGRIASLLEVGTGFHLELTGRENVFLNGAILGMTRKDIERKFDEIAAFSDIGEFLDTPVKRYSSGMSVRLAFAVAAHLEPEILVIDEVLAVGDASFQQKCLGKMGQVAGSGRTVLFVSHNAAAVEALCRRGLVLDEGRLVFDGTQTEALSKYAESYSIPGTSLRERTDRRGSGEVRLVAAEIRDANARVVQRVHSGEDIELWLHFENSGYAHNSPLNARINVTTHLGAAVFTQSNMLVGQTFGDLPEQGAFVCRIPRLPLPAASYRVEVHLTKGYRRGELVDAVASAFELHVESGDFFSSGNVPNILAGVALVDGKWRLESSTDPVLTSPPAGSTAPQHAL